MFVVKVPVLEITRPPTAKLDALRSAVAVVLFVPEKVPVSVAPGTPPVQFVAVPQAAPTAPFHVADAA
jgi:hypothetical protein